MSSATQSRARCARALRRRGRSYGPRSRPEQPLEGAAERGPQVGDLLERADLEVLQGQRAASELLPVLGLRDHDRLAQPLEDFDVPAVRRGDFFERFEEPGQLAAGLARVRERGAREPGFAAREVGDGRLLDGQEARHDIV
jgi:hypothetical protein